MDRRTAGVTGMRREGSDGGCGGVGRAVVEDDEDGITGRSDDPGRQCDHTRPRAERNGGDSYATHERVSSILQSR
jgi:hypothetical protein